MSSDNKGRDIFYGVVAIATLIVAIVGATLAYFSVTANSAEGAVNAQSAIVSIEYNDGQQVTAQADKLIPSSLEVVQTVYEEKVKDINSSSPSQANACIDSNSQQVCSAYRFSVRSDVERTISATLNNEYNGFTYLSYAVYDVTNGGWLNLNGDNDKSLPLTACSNQNESTSDDCYALDGTLKKYNSPGAINSIFGYTLEENVVKNQTKKIASATQVYDLILFIRETNQNQNIDQGQSYKGTIIVDVIDGGMSGQITGCVGDNC